MRNAVQESEQGSEVLRQYARLHGMKSRGGGWRANVQPRHGKSSKERDDIKVNLKRSLEKYNQRMTFIGFDKCG